jgi:hypothetical protein
MHLLAHCTYGTKMHRIRVKKLNIFVDFFTVGAEVIQMTDKPCKDEAQTALFKD